MKKFLIAAIILSSTALAQHRVGVPQVTNPICKQGKIMYQSPHHMFIDFCINGMNAASAAECNIIIDEQKAAGIHDQVAIDFFNGRFKSLCGK